MLDARVLLQDLSSKGKIVVTIKGKRNDVLKIQEIFLAILAFLCESSKYLFLFVDILWINPHNFG